MLRSVCFEEEVDFDEFTPKLTTFIERHRKSEKAKRERKKSVEEASKTNESASGKEEITEEPDADMDESQAGEDDNEPIRKRRKSNDLEERWEGEDTEDIDDDSADDEQIPVDNIQDDDGSGDDDEDGSDDVDRDGDSHNIETEDEEE